MELCSSGHEEIAYDSEPCPLCQSIKEVEALESKVESLEQELETAEEEINELNRGDTRL